jgi:hypothetical protein
MKNARLANAVATALALWSATGCVLSAKLLGHSGDSPPSSTSSSSGSTSSDSPSTSGASDGGSGSEQATAAGDIKATPELEAESQDPAYRSYQAEYAKRLLAELEAVHQDPAKRTRPDDEILIALHVYANSLYLFGDKVQKPWALQMWTRGKQLAQTPKNVGERDEVVSTSLRWAAVALSDLRGFERAGGEMASAFDPVQALADLEKHVAAHEKEFLGGKQSARARALLAAGKKIAADYSKQFAKQGAKAKKQRAYDEDPEVKKLDADWHELNIEAGGLAERLGEDAPSAWANSTHPSLMPYQKTLATYQAKLRKLRKKHGMPE